MVNKQDDRKLESVWNDAKGYLEMIRNDIQEFNRLTAEQNFESAYYNMVNAIDNVYPYLIRWNGSLQETTTYDDETNFWHTANRHLESAKIQLFSWEHKEEYNQKDDEHRKIKAKRNTLAYEEMRKAKQILLRCLDKARGLLPLEYKDDWYKSATNYG